MKQIRTTVLIGAGAIGAFFIPGLVHVLGDDFCVIASGARKERLEAEGMVVNGEHVFFQVRSPEEVKNPDLILIATKYGALTEVCEMLRLMTGPDTTVISTLNGIDSEEIIGEAIGMESVVYGFMRVSAVRKGNIVTYGLKNRGLFFGERDGSISERVQAIDELLTQAGINHIVSSDIIKDQWFKYACNIAENQSQALLSVPFGSFRDNAHVNFVRLELMKECLAVAKAKGIVITEEELAHQEGVLKTLPYLNKTSMLQDLEQHRTTEVDMLAGTLVHLGEALSVPTPYNRFVYHAIKAMEDRNAGAFDKDPDHAK